MNLMVTRLPTSSPLFTVPILLGLDDFDVVHVAVKRWRRSHQRTVRPGSSFAFVEDDLVPVDIDYEIFGPFQFGIDVLGLTGSYKVVPAGDFFFRLLFRPSVF